MSLLDSPKLSGLATNILVAEVAAIGGNALVFGLNLNAESKLVAPPWAPSPIVIGAVWIVLFGLMATARWLLNRCDHPRRWADQDLIVALVAVCWAYPFYAIAPGNRPLGLIGTLLTVALAMYVANRLRELSPLAAGLLVPVIVWLWFAVAITAATMQIAGS